MSEKKKPNHFKEDSTENLSKGSVAKDVAVQSSPNSSNGGLSFWVAVIALGVSGYLIYKTLFPQYGININKDLFVAPEASLTNEQQSEEEASINAHLIALKTRVDSLEINLKNAEDVLEYIGQEFSKIPTLTRNNDEGISIYELRLTLIDTRLRSTGDTVTAVKDLKTLERLLSFNDSEILQRVKDDIVRLEKTPTRSALAKELIEISMSAVVPSEIKSISEGNPSSFINAMSNIFNFRHISPQQEKSLEATQKYLTNARISLLLNDQIEYIRMLKVAEKNFQKGKVLLTDEEIAESLTKRLAELVASGPPFYQLHALASEPQLEPQK